MQRSCLTLLLMTLLAIPTAYAGDDVWLFKVRLDDKEIGTHRFERHGTADAYTMEVNADFKATLFLVVPFRYTHRNTEHWKNGCLERIDSSTNDNGDSFKVSGHQSAEDFTITVNDNTRTLERCISTFSYWDQRFLTRNALLNSQDGSYPSIKIKDLGDDQVSAFGQKTSARHYRLEAEKLELHLWYTAEGDWLALESPAKGGMTLRYERIKP